MTVILSIKFAEVKNEFEIKMKFDNTVLFWQNQSALQHKLAFTQIHTDLHTVLGSNELHVTTLRNLITKFT